MVDIRVRGLDVKVIERLKAQAKRNSHSVDAELRRIVEAAASETRVRTRPPKRMPHG
jgi:plasmid stability protein